MTTGVTAIEYKWRDGARMAIAPEVAGREFERIAKRDMEIVPETVVEESRAQNSPLHSWFEWDDSIAAQEHRMNQARKLIRTLEIVYVRNDIEEPLPPVRAYVSVMDEPEYEMYAPNKPKQSSTRHYRPILKVMTNEDLRDQYRRQAFDTLCNWRDRYRDIEDFARIFEEIDTLKERFKAA